MSKTLALRVSGLTQRQLEVVQYLAQGRDTPSVARAMKISPHTVKFHINLMLKKTGAANSRHLVAMACLAGVVPAETVESVLHEPQEAM